MFRILGALLAVALFALAALNPGMAAFESFVEEQSEQILRKEAGDSALGKALSGAGAALAGSYVSKITERDNYLVCSFYTLDVDRDGAPDRRFLGLANRFFELDADAS